jgi:cytochrome b561
MMVGAGAAVGGGRYDRIAACIHWAVAALLLGQLALGFIFHSMDHGATRNAWFAWHKGVGGVLLLLTLLRLGWRYTHKPPPLPATMPLWQRKATAWSQRFFYFLLVALPVTGLVSVAAWNEDGDAARVVAGLRLPVVPWITKGVGDSAEQFHKLLIMPLNLLIALHLAAAAKHQFWPRQAPALSGRMPPLRRRIDAMNPLSGAAGHSPPPRVAPFRRRRAMAFRQTPRNSKLMRLGVLAVIAAAVFVVIF